MGILMGVMKTIWRVMVLAGLAIVGGFATSTMKDLVKDSITKLFAAFRWTRAQFAA